jgi:hypothetical protein
MVQIFQDICVLANRISELTICSSKAGCSTVYPALQDIYQTLQDIGYPVSTSLYPPPKYNRFSDPTLQHTGFSVYISFFSFLKTFLYRILLCSNNVDTNEELLVLIQIYLVYSFVGQQTKHAGDIFLNIPAQ